MIISSRLGATLKTVQQVQTSQQLDHRYIAALISQTSSSSQHVLQSLDSKFANINKKLDMLESGLLPGINPREDVGQLQSYQAGLPIFGSGAKTVVSWRWSSYRLPIGDLSMSMLAKQASEKNAETSKPDSVRGRMELTFAPLSWISRNVVRISCAIESAQYGGPGFKFSLSQAYHNPNPLLIQALRDSSLLTLQQMFDDGLARPTDLVSDWRRSLLHVSTSGAFPRKN